MARIDATVIGKLVFGQIVNAGAGGFPVFNLGEQIPEGLSLYGVLAGLRLIPGNRVSGTDEPDQAEIEVTVVVAAMPIESTESSWNLFAAGTAMYALLDEFTARDVTTTHQIDLQRAELEYGGEMDEQRGMRTATVSVKGRAVRTSGMTMVGLV